MLKSNLMNNLLRYMLETPKALSTIFFYIISENLKDDTMDNQQVTKVLYLIVWPSGPLIYWGIGHYYSNYIFFN